jgi:hypothetical protein
MARDIAGALGPSLNAGPVPTNARKFVEYAGGKRAAVEQLTGLDGPPRRADYGRRDAAFREDRLRWLAAQRRVERWTTEGRERRGGTRDVDLTRAQKTRARRDANRRRREEIARRGLRARMHVKTRVDTPGKRADVRTRWIPALGAPATYIDPDTTREILEKLSDDRDAAGEDFLDALWLSYDVDPDLIEVEEVLELKVWPEGEPEPE